MNIVNNANRDVFVGEIAKALAYETNEHEISLFGFAYLEKGSIQYFFTENETNAFHMQQVKIEKNICTTPIEMITRRTTIAPCAEDEVKSQLQKILQQKYSEDFFRFLALLNASEANNQAQPLLEKYLNNFTSETDDVLRQANYNLITLAHCAKHINELSYVELIKKSQFIKEETAQTQTASNVRVLAGIAYFQLDQTIAYYCNAYLPNVYKQKIALEKKNYIVSPVLHISYDLSNIKNHSMKDLKENFMSALRQTINFEYMKIVREIKTFPSATNSLLFHENLNKVKLQLTDDSLDAINIYSKLWNITRE